MSNSCDFTMKIAGREEAVRDLCDRLSWRGQYQNNGLGRVDEFTELTPPIATDTLGIITVEAEGTCAWSIKTAMRDNTPSPNREETTLDKETGRLHLAIEAYSSEPGFAFQEHLLLINGQVRIDDCIDYYEIYAKDRDQKEIEEELNRIGYTSETAPPVNENGDICIEGYGENYGNFKELDALLPELAIQQQKSPLKTIIQTAAEQRNTEIKAKEQNNSKGRTR